MNFDWLMKHIDSNNHIICSVWYFDGIYFDDMVKFFGHPNIPRNKKDKWDHEDRWLYELFNGDKVEMHFDINGYITDKMMKLNLKSHGPLEQTEIPVMTVMCGHEVWKLINLFLSSIFGKDISDKQKLEAFKYLFGDVE